MSYFKEILSLSIPAVLVTFGITSVSIAENSQAYFLTSCTVPRTINRNFATTPDLNLRATDRRHNMQSAMLYDAQIIFGGPDTPQYIGVSVGQSQSSNGNLIFPVYNSDYQQIAAVTLSQDNYGSLSGEFVALPGTVQGLGLGRFILNKCSVSVDGINNVAGEWELGG